MHHIIYIHTYALMIYIHTYTTAPYDLYTCLPIQLHHMIYIIHTYAAYDLHTCIPIQLHNMIYIILTCAAYYLHTYLWTICMYRWYEHTCMHLSIYVEPFEHLTKALLAWLSNWSTWPVRLKITENVWGAESKHVHVVWLLLQWVTPSMNTLSVHHLTICLTYYVVVLEFFVIYDADLLFEKPLKFYMLLYGLLLNFLFWICNFRNSSRFLLCIRNIY